MKIEEIDLNWTSQVQTLCYVVSDWDREQWQSYLTAFPHVQQSINVGEQRMKGWALFCEEVFHRLLTVPQAIPYDQLRPEVKWAHQLHMLIDESVDFSEMQLACRNNKLASGQATYRLIELAVNALPKPPKSFKDPATVEGWQEKFVQVQAKIVAHEATQQQLAADIQAETDPDLQHRLRQQLDQIAFDIGELRAQLSQVTCQIGKAEQSILDYAKLIGEAMADMLTVAIYEAMRATITYLGAMNAFGWGEGMGVLNTPGNAQEKEAIALRFAKDNRFRAIAEAAGRFQAIAALYQGAKRSQQVPDELADSSLGNNLSRLAPSEWARMAIEQLRSMFLKDYADESLVQMEFDGAVDEGQQGPVVICLDKSGSMIDGTKEIDSTGLMLALVSIAQEQNRKARVILFDDPVRYVKDIDPLTATPSDRIDLADRMYAGGTNFMAPLEKALEAIEQNADLHNADVIFITDGEADVTEEFSRKWRESQQRLGFKVFTLIIGNYIDSDVLARFSDRNIAVSDLGDPQVYQVFGI